MKSKYIKRMPNYKVLANGALGLQGIGGPGAWSALDKNELIRPQAQIIIHKFGGPRELARVLKECSDDPADHYDPSTIYRWMYPRSKGGSGGEIPLPALQTILKCARLAGVMLTTKDLYPNMAPQLQLDLDQPEMFELPPVPNQNKANEE